MVSFGNVAGLGMIATILTGAIATVLIQPLVLSSIPVSGYAIVASWVIALGLGYVVAMTVWGLVIAFLMVTMFNEASEQIDEKL